MTNDPLPVLEHPEAPPLVKESAGNVARIYPSPKSREIRRILSARRKVSHI